MPSLVTRICDVVFINSASLLPVIHMHTTPEGGLTWSLLGCPCLEDIPSAVGDRNAASGSTRWFGLHTGEHLIQKVHEVEEALQLRREDRAYRLVATVADQAIQGPGSTRFTEKECETDRLPYSALKEGVCKFHVSEGVGTNVDKWYGETHVFDRMLRLIRRHFAWGAGHLIYRAVAHKFDSLVQDFEAKAQQCLEAAAREETNSSPLAAARMRRQAAKQHAEAQAIIRAGWNKWRTPLAPTADGTRKTVYQNKTRGCFFTTFGITYWGLLARMQQSLESAREAQKARGAEITAKTGLNTKAMKAWRSLGRAMLDIRILVFNLGRVDYRRKHLAAYALECQTSLHLLPGDAAYACSQDMLAAVGVLVEMQGIVRMMNGLCSGRVFEQRGQRGVIKELDGGPWRQKNLATAWWATCRTLLSHRC